MRVERIVHTRKDARGQDVLAHVVEKYHYTPAEVAIAKSRAVFRDASVAASQLLEATMVMVERGESVIVDGQRVVVTAEAAGAVAKSLIRRVAYMTTRPLAKAGLFEVDRPESVERIVPVEESAHSQPGAEPIEHLDADRAKKIPNVLTPAMIDSGVSKKIAKALSDRGWESVESADEFSHFAKRDVGEVILAPEGFALKSRWDGKVVTGDSVPDLEAALDAVE
jgi:hypothetical protein